MKKLIVILCCLLNSYMASADDLCPDRFPELDKICWDCMYPIIFAQVSSNSLSSGNNEDFDTDAGSSPVCACVNQILNAKAGGPLQFWEQIYFMDVHTTPGCLPAAGGITIDVSFMGKEKEYGTISNNDDRTSTAFRHVAFYKSPMMYLTSLVLDEACSDRSAFDLGFATEFDPTWNDDEMAALMTPMMYATSSIPGIMASMIDAAMVNMLGQSAFPSGLIDWHAGGLGPINPMTGFVSAYQSMDQTGRLLVARALAKKHAAMQLSAKLAPKEGRRTYTCETSWGEGDIFNCADNNKAVMCAGSDSTMPIQIRWPKRGYKIQRLYPHPYTAKHLFGGCCQPIGRSTILTEAGAQLPLPANKDFVYTIFRKRECCQGAVTPASII